MQVATKVEQLAQVDSDYRSDLKDIIEKMPAAQHLGVKVVGFKKSGRSRVELQIGDHHTFNGKFLQAGVIGALADYAGVSASAAALGVGWMATTAGFEVHNLAPAAGEKLVAIGEVLLAKPAHSVSSVLVYSVGIDDSLKLVASAMTTCKPFQLSL